MATAMGARRTVYRPAPQVNGNLQIDPEIVLPSPGMDLRITLYYNSGVPNPWASASPVGPYRTISPNLLAVASGSPLVVTMIRGTGAVVPYDGDAAGGFATGTQGVFNTLVRDTAGGLWLETTPQGLTTAYPLITSGAYQQVAWVENAVGVRQTYTYSGTHLKTIQDGVGRLVNPSSALTTTSYLVTGIIDPNGYGTQLYVRLRPARDITGHDRRTTKICDRRAPGWSSPKSPGTRRWFCLHRQSVREQLEAELAGDEPIEPSQDFTG